MCQLSQRKWPRGQRPYNIKKPTKGPFLSAFRVKTKVPMSQVAVLPHQTSNGSASASSASQPDIGQLSLHNVASTRRKSSFSNVNNYRTMPLSRTRSLLANINGVASNGKCLRGRGLFPFTLTQQAEAIIVIGIKLKENASGCSSYRKICQ